MADHLRFGERTPSAVAVPNVRGAMIPPVLMRTAADIRRNECAVVLRKKFDPFIDEKEFYRFLDFCYTDVKERMKREGLTE